MSASSAVATTARARLPSSRAMPTCSRMRRRQPDRARRAAGRPGGGDPDAPQLVDRAEDGDPVAPCSGWSRPGHIAMGPPPDGHDGHGRQVAEVGRGRCRGCALRARRRVGRRRSRPRQLNGVRRPAQAGLDEGGRGQRRDVEHAAGTRHPFQGPGHRRVGQLDHEGQVRADLPDAQCRLERVDLVDLHADHGGGPRQTRLFESFAPVGVSPDVGDPPVVEGPPAAGIGVVVDHHHRGAAEVELLHGTQPDALQPADDHVALHALGLREIHPGMLPARIGAEVAAPLNVGSPPNRRLEPHLGAVAQWSEQRTHNPWVVGSIPTSPTDAVARRAGTRTRPCATATW